MVSEANTEVMRDQKSTWYEAVTFGVNAADEIYKQTEEPRG